VLRTAWRIKKKRIPPGTGSNRRPDYQEVLSGLEFGVWVADGPLAARLKTAGDNYGNITRYGGLSLGESRDLVDEVSFDPDWGAARGLWLSAEDTGAFPLPVWVDHVGSKGTRWVQFAFKEAPLEEPPPEDARWISIEPPAA